MAGKVLIVLTSVDKYPDGSATGWYAPEAIHPYNKFKAAGYEVQFASITGKATCDPSSLPGDEECVAFWGDEALKASTETNAKLEDCNAADYAAVLFAGGFGVMWDFPTSEVAQKMILATYEAGKPIAAVCHGPIVFKNVKLADGSFLVAGKEVTGFTNAEEVAVGKTDVVAVPSGPGSCEDALTAVGAKFKDGGVFQPNVCIAGNLITGQNPPSAGPIAEAIVNFLKK